MKAEIRDAQIHDVSIIQKIAQETWPHAYGSILSAAQLKYMLDALYAEHVLRQLIETQQQHFLLLTKDEIPLAFAAYGLLHHHTYKLHKLYILPAHQGKGYGKKLIEEVIHRLREIRQTKLLLNVNRQNNAVEFYKKIGFRTIRNEDTPIGPFWMHDYLMQIKL